jgi:hypothetical protein
MRAITTCSVKGSGSFLVSIPTVTLFTGGISKSTPISLVLPGLIVSSLVNWCRATSCSVVGSIKKVVPVNGFDRFLGFVPERNCVSVTVPRRSHLAGLSYCVFVITNLGFDPARRSFIRRIPGRGQLLFRTGSSSPSHSLRLSTAVPLVAFCIKLTVCLGN